MKKVWENGIVRIMCMVLFMYEISMICQTGMRIMLPNYVYAGNSEQSLWEDRIKERADLFLPIFAYTESNPVKSRRKDIFPIKALKKDEMLTLMDLENSSFGAGSLNGTIEGDQDIQGDILAPSKDGISQSEGGGASQSMEETGLESVPDQETGSGIFVKHEKRTTIALEDLADYETLVKQFYTIDASTMIGADELNAKKLGNMDMTLKQTADAPQILIYHTHSQEGFIDSVAGDDSTTIMGVGARLKEILEEEYGYQVMHHQGKYDVKSRDGAYSDSLPEIKKVLEENPTIEVVIDLHRDAVADESRHLVMDLDGRPTAQFMFFNGISRTRSTGKIAYLYNENLEANLAFSFQMKWKAEEYYPGLTRRNYLNAYRYNMHLLPKTLLLELGAQNNTLEEAMNACDPIAHILHIVLSGEDNE